MDLDLAGVHPLLAMPCHRDIPVKTACSLLDTQSLMQGAKLGLSLDIQEGSSLVHHARNRATHAFLQSECTHLFWVDSDIVWDAKDFLRLVALGTKFECVCAAYPRKAPGNEFYLRYLTKQIVPNEYGLVPIKGTGIGFTIVQRKVVEQLAEKAPKLRFKARGPQMAAIFRADDEEYGQARGEDYSFFDDVLKLGYDVNLDPTITLGHIGPMQFRASIMECVGEMNE